MQLSIILVNYRGWKKLRLCLESLKCLATIPVESEVIVVDNCSNDGVLNSFIRDFPEFRFAENSGNSGFAQGCNFGASIAKGDYFLFLNPDTIVNAHAIETLYQTAVEHPEYSILTCRQVTDSGKDTRPYGLFLTPSTLFSSFRAFHRVLKQPIKDQSEAIRSPEWVSGSLIMMSRKVFNQVKGWDEDFWMYYEDMDLCRRIRNQNGQIVLLNDISIIHNHGGASRINLSTKVLSKSEVLISKHVYVSKHFTGLSKPLAQTAIVLNNLLLIPLIMGILGMLLFFIPALSAYFKLYRSMVKYYLSALRNKKWISPRSVRY